MFYHQKEKSGFFIWSDHTKGKYGPFESIFSKNEWFGIYQEFDVSEYPGYKYSLGFTKQKIFILEKDGKVMIKKK